MVIAVTDANIFIDLIRLEMLNYLFDLEVEIHTTYEVYNQLNKDQELIAQKFVQNNSLTIYSFSIEELNEIFDLDCPAGLELADKTVFYYASKTNGIVLSGDDKLRKFCIKQHHDVKGIIWIFDQLLELNILSPTFLSSKLEQLTQFNTRLPMSECEKRIQNWKTKLNE